MIQGKHIVLACKKNILWQVLNQAQQIGHSIIVLTCNCLNGWTGVLITFLNRSGYSRAKLDTD